MFALSEWHIPAHFRACVRLIVFDVCMQVSGTRFLFRVITLCKLCCLCNVVFDPHVGALSEHIVLQRF